MRNNFSVSFIQILTAAHVLFASRNSINKPKKSSVQPEKLITF